MDSNFVHDGAVLSRHKNKIIKANKFYDIYHTTLGQGVIMKVVSRVLSFLLSSGFDVNQSII
jgi:hypothetical protein